MLGLLGRTWRAAQSLIDLFFSGESEISSLFVRISIWGINGDCSMVNAHYLLVHLVLL